MLFGERATPNGAPTPRSACVFLCAIFLASSECQQLAFDNMQIYKCGHSSPPGILFCDFKDLGHLLNVAANHDREWNAVIVAYGS